MAQGKRRVVLLAKLLVAVCCAGATMALGAEITPPQGSDLRVTLFASEPDIVTPIGATVDAKGRLLVVESQSHFRPKNYEGPPTDRIRLLEDTTGSGKADKISTFYEGSSGLMNIAAEPGGSVVVTSRNELFRLDDSAEAGEPVKTSLAMLKTKADYPHNGLHGLAVDHEGMIYFAIGENLGAPWVLEGTDGKTISDHTGSGTIFRVDSKGHDLTRIARGFWNPFGLGVDSENQLWAVDNDPDGRPPCRLIPVAIGGEYGFEFRYGRTGMHPLQAWDGELPGTLGMAAGVGEAPCAVLEVNHGLLVSSWRDHVVQTFSTSLHGATWSAEAHTLLSGGEAFRPTGLALGKGGALYVMDWGSGSYPINGKGRIWKVTLPLESATTYPTLRMYPETVRASALRASHDVSELLAAMDDPDRATEQAAQYGLSQTSDVEKIEWSALKSTNQKIGVLAAVLWRGSSTERFIADALKDSDDRVRQMGVRAASEQQIASALAPLQELMTSQVLSPRLLGMTLATINQLNGDPAARIDSRQIERALMSRINAPDATDASRATSLHMLAAGHPKLDIAQLEGWTNSPNDVLRIEAVRYLSDDLQAERFAPLAKLAADAGAPAAVRADAIAGLSDDAANQLDLLLKSSADSDASIRHEALRSLRPIASMLKPDQQSALKQVAGKYPDDGDLVKRLLGEPAAPRPTETDLAGWGKLLDAAPGNADEGRRIFFHHAEAQCYRCHMIEGRGRSIGPDLTMIGHSQTREHLLQSILQPSAEIAPLYTLWSITTKSNQQIDGMLLRRDGQEMEVYVDSTGQETKVAEPNVVDRRMRKESLMPAGLVVSLTTQEVRDLIAMLMQKR